MMEVADGAVRAIGRKTGRGFVVSAIAGIVAGWVLSFIYSPACHLIPIVYVNILVTVILGYVVGSVCRTFIRKYRIDNAALATVAGAIAGVVTWWLCWVSHVWTVFDYHFVIYKEAFLSPFDLPYIIQAIAHDPNWSIGKKAGDPWFYYAVWLGEFLIILITAASIPRSFVKEHRLCGTCNDWLVPTGDIALFDISNADVSILDTVGRGELESLPNLPGLPGGQDLHSNSWLEAKAFACPNCEGAGAFVTVSHVALKPGKKKDELEKSEKVLVRLQAVSEELEAMLFVPPEEAPPIEESAPEPDAADAEAANAH